MRCLLVTGDDTGIRMSAALRVHEVAHELSRDQQYDDGAAILER
jgi:hypothetical protein